MVLVRDDWDGALAHYTLEQVEAGGWNLRTFWRGMPTGGKVYTHDDDEAFAFDEGEHYVDEQYRLEAERLGLVNDEADFP